MHNDASSPTLTNVTFSDNLVAPGGGGGMFNVNNSNPALVNVAFFANTSGNGGGMYNQSSNPSLTDVSFSANVSTGDGGGLSNFVNSSPALTNVIFSGNVASEDGGGMRNQFGSHPTLTNVLFSGNSASINGGGMWNGETAGQGSSPTLINVTFSGNLAVGLGGGMYNGDNSHPMASNSILWNNRDSNGTGTLSATVFNSNGTITLTNSLVQGTGGSASWTADPSFVDGGNNLDIDPLFVLDIDPSTAPAITGNLRLSSGSSAIDSGLNSAIVITTDLAGNSRFVDGDFDGAATVDMGVYESSGSCPGYSLLHVDKSASGDGGSWATAFPDLQNALTAARVCGSVTEIWVAAGVYTPGASTTDTFQLLNDVAIYGGFAATETLRTQRDWVANPTVLSGDIGGDDSTDANGVVTTTADISGANSYHVVTGSGVAATAQLDGFTITAGYANGFSPDSIGGGMYTSGGSPTLTNLTFSGNLAQDEGGGMGNLSLSNPTIANVTFTGNSAASGGGMYNLSSSATMTNTVFVDNAATSGVGAGVYDYQSHSRLTNVIFSGNTASNGAGAMLNFKSNSRLTNVTFSGNWTGGDGGGLVNFNSDPILTNVTFSGNSAVGNGGAILNDANSNPWVYNSILWNNRDSNGSGTIGATVVNQNSSAISLTHSIVQGAGESGVNWTADPTIMDGGSPGFSISAGARPIHEQPGHRPAICSGCESDVCAHHQRRSAPAI